MAHLTLYDLNLVVFEFVFEVLHISILFESTLHQFLQGLNCHSLRNIDICEAESGIIDPEPDTSRIPCVNYACRDRARKNIFYTALDLLTSNQQM